MLLILAAKTEIPGKISLLAVFLFYCLLPICAHGQDRSGDGASTHGQRSIRAVRTELPVIVDGNLDEPAWQETPLALGFIQKDPLEGQPSTERTEFRILHTATTLYIGVICYDSDPQGILATDRRRDSKLENDDTVTLVLDTFHDHRNSFMFRTNPLGTRYDALITDEGNTLNENWDENWEIAAQITQLGWTAEFAIPFKSLRVREGDGHVWGLDLERVIRRKNEQSYWNNYRRGFNLQNVSQAGHLQGIENIETGMRLRVKPYLMGGFSQTVRRESPTSNQFGSSYGNASKIGMEVMKYRITPSLTADFTWNTDFAQTEVDDQQVNLDRFSIFFPEKREFFLEGAGIYEFGLAQSEALTDLKLFHTRTIGLSEGRERIPVPITAGARVTGNLKGFTLGLMDVQTNSLRSQNIAENNYGVLRVKRNVLSRSYIGGFFLNREFSGSEDFNRVYGLDANFIFHEYLTLSSLWGKSSKPENENREGSDWVSNGTVKWEDDFWFGGADYVFIEPDFRNDLGFVPRTNMRRVTPYLGIKPRPKSGPIRQVNLNYRHDYITDRNWEVQTQTAHYNASVTFQSGDSINTSPIHFRFERLTNSFHVRPGLTVAPGDYEWWYIRIQYSANPARRLSGTIVYKPEVGYFGGKLVQWDVQPRLRVNNNVSFGLGYKINDFTFGESKFTDHVVNFRAYYDLNNQWLTTTTIQYNNVDSFAGINFRLNYILRPSDNLFLVYNEGRQVEGPLDGQEDRSLLLKLTYSFDF